MWLSLKTNYSLSCVQSTLTGVWEIIRPSEELSFTLSSELILKVGKLSTYYDTPLINTNAMASPLKHGDMSCHDMYVWDISLSAGLIYSSYRSSISVLLTVGCWQMFKSYLSNLQFVSYSGILSDVEKKILMASPKGQCSVHYYL